MAPGKKTQLISVSVSHFVGPNLLSLVWAVHRGFLQPESFLGRAVWEPEPVLPGLGGKHLRLVCLAHNVDVLQRTRPHSLELSFSKPPGELELCGPVWWASAVCGI